MCECVGVSCVYIFCCSEMYVAGMCSACKIEDMYDIVRKGLGERVSNQERV